MLSRRVFQGVLLGILTGCVSSVTSAQGQPGFGGPRGGPGGPMSQERKLVKSYDKDGDGRLNSEERKTAREALRQEREEGGGRGGFGGPGGFAPGRGFGPPGGPGGRGNREPAKPGPRVSPTEVKSYPNAEMYAPNVLRTLFLDFENKDWEAELDDFHGTDVEVPATLTVDGKKYPGVGIHFRGMSSYMMVPAGYKRSLNLSIDHSDPKQRLYGYKTLNLLNVNGDPSFLSSILYSHIARQYIPAPKANFVKLVINGESWGVYTNVQQFDKIFLNENYKTDKGVRWKVSGSPGGDGGLNYVGDDIAQYKRRYEIKNNDEAKSWKALINLCRTLSETPTDQLEAALEPILDIDSALWFLALDVALMNSDGYWIRASDYSIYLDEKGKFHIIPHDMNEAFRAEGGPGGPDGFGMRPPRLGEILPSFLQEILQLTDRQKQQIAALQKEVDGKIAQILTAEQREQLKNMQQGGPFGPGGFPGGPGGFPGGRPGGFPPGGLGENPPGKPENGFALVGAPGQGGRQGDRRGPGGFGMAMSRPGEILPVFLQEMLQLTDRQRQQIATLQKEVDGKIAQILTAEQREQLKNMQQGGPFGPGGFPGGPGGPGGFPPGGGFPGGPGGPQGGFAGPGGFPQGGPGQQGGRQGGRGGPGGPGMGMRGGSLDLDPLVGMEDTRKPLRSRLLAVPHLKTRYLQYVRAIAEDSLYWKKLGPVVAQYRSLVVKEIEADTRKLTSFEAFLRATADTAQPAGNAGQRGPGGNSLRAFADQRRAYLLAHPEIKKLTPQRAAAVP